MNILALAKATQEHSPQGVGYFRSRRIAFLHLLMR